MAARHYRFVRTGAAVWLRHQEDIGTVLHRAGRSHSTAARHGVETLLAGLVCLGRQCAGADWICLAVSDDGRGMAPEVRQPVFDACYTTGCRDGSAGLGAAGCSSRFWVSQQRHARPRPWSPSGLLGEALDDPAAPEPFDFVVPVAQLGEDLVGVLTQGGWR